MKAEHALIMGVGLFSLFIGIILVLSWLLGGFTRYPVSQLIIGLILLAGGGYLAYYPYSYKVMSHIVARPATFKDVYYDEKGLYYNTDGKPYLFKWDEIKEYRILSVTEVNLYPMGFFDSLFPGVYFMMSWVRYMIWRKIDPEYASTGIMKLGTVQFIKKDGSSVILNNVLNPYRLVPIFDKYINENDQKKGYHM